MASTSTSSSVQKSFQYDVFLSFRGEDTRKKFVDHLYHALQHQSIITYKDDQRIQKGKKISDELIRSIEDSRFYIIVFSKNYASSSWCLDELVKIMECQKTTDQTAYPVFYDIKPTEVRHQSGSVGEAFAKHEKNEAAAKWGEALKEAADLAGWELKNTVDGHEDKFIQKIVQEISLELRFIDSSVDGKLIGMESRVKNVVSALETGCDDVRMIGIKGMGGAGKTTLARAVFDQMSIHFQGKSFVENVREVSTASLSGLNKLQKQIMSDVLNDHGIKIGSVHDGKKMMKKMMCGRKVLVVLDDVDNVEQLEALAGEPNWFKSGSRIIITTRDEQVLVAHRVNLILDVNLLSDEEAVCLFSRYAFGKEIPIHGYEELSGNVVRYAAGLPLTIRVLGSFLCGKIHLEWIDTLERLKTIPLKDTLEKLEISYISLEEDYKEIFLDVACIMKGWLKETAVQALESCGFHAINGLRVLEQKSLITISNGGVLGMHDHIEEMGKNIVRRSHPDEPNRHSRLWIPEEIEDILTNDLGNDAVQCIQWSSISNETYMRGLRNLKKLRVLEVYNEGEGVASECFPNALRYLKWDHYLSPSLMDAFQPANLVGLSMPHSRRMQFWESGERKVLRKLKFLDMSDSDLRTLDLEMTPNIEMLNLASCHHLAGLNMPLGCSNQLKALYLISSGLRTLNLAPTPNLEILNLSRCSDLAELTMPYQLSKLKVLNFSFTKLKTLELAPTPDLETLYLERCKDLVELIMPYQCPKLRFIEANSSKLKTLDLGMISNLETLRLENCHDLVELHMPNDCPMLKSLSLRCSNLSSLNLASAPNLEYLHLHGCHGLVELHMPSRCPKLRSLYLYSHKLRTLDLGLISDLEILSLKECHDLEELYMANGCPNIKSLIVENSNIKRINLGLTPDLEMLRLENCHDLSEFHFPFQCPKLNSFTLNYSKLRTFDFRLTPNIETLSLEECQELVELHMPSDCPKLKYLNLKNSALRNLKLGLTPDLETLRLNGCHGMVELHLPFGCPKLQVLSLECSKLRTLYHVHTPDIETLSLEGRCQLLELHMPNEFPELKSLSLNNLQLSSLTVGLTPNLVRFIINEKFVYLNLTEYGGFKSFSFDKQIKSPGGSLHVIAESMHSDSNLPKFRFSCLYEEPISSSIGKFLLIGICSFTNLESFSESICNLQYLRKLTLEGSIPEVPKGLDRLQWLEELSLLSTNIKHLPDSICMLTNLKLLQLNSCLFIEKLPEGLGRLKCMEDLNLTLCIRLQDIPKSICDMRRLKRLNLSSCLHVKRLPREVGHLECLKELNIKETGISDLPDGIFGLQGLHVVASDGLSFTV